MSLLSVRNLGKAYRSYSSEWHRVARWLGIPIRPKVEHWTLKGISFDIGRGEALGIVGQNGAGKSTLLKLITGTLQATEGQVQVQGRIAAILELGMGFNPELTGRQNAFHAAGLMGYPTQQIEQAMPDIEAFAEIGEYFDEPVRAYSSGMQMRVAFAVATAFRPDLLIVDEALSVGDAYFQHKCMERIRTFQEQGTSLLLVSHAPDTVRMFCQKAILLKDGHLMMEGDAASVMDFYRANQVWSTTSWKDECLINQTTALHEERDTKFVLSSRTAGPVQVSIVSDKSAIHSGDHVTLNIRASFNEGKADPHIGFGIRNKLGIVIYEANTYTLGYRSEPVQAGSAVTASFNLKCDLAPGTYELMIGVAAGGYNKGSFQESIFFDQSFLIFEVALGPHTGWAGLYNIQPEVKYPA